ncbi:MAG: hypothetical protein A2Y12_04075 [Planctomycetes bacterium GWF2_42_9]|nr:MAG: hypothetical protein A2Y12_04075 [Planctomycetes bacterium GWF2_42_9]
MGAALVFSMGLAARSDHDVAVPSYLHGADGGFEKFFHKGGCKMNVQRILILGVLLCWSGLAQAGTWLTLDMPNATGTKIYGISGNNVVGSSSLGNFIYNMATDTWAIQNTPDIIKGIDGTNFVGDYGDYYHKHGFLYDGTNLTTLDLSDVASTRIEGIDGRNVVGYYDTGRGTLKHGFFYDGSNWATLDKPGSHETFIVDLDGDNLVGWYTLTGSTHTYGFSYNMATQIWTSLSGPGPGSSAVTGISGENLVGTYYYYYQTHSFLYDGTTWAILDMPEANGHSTIFTGIDGDKITGYYYDTSGNTHGLIYAIPEPATMLLLASGGLLFNRYNLT